MEEIKHYLVPYILSNFIFGLALIGAWKKPLWTRIFLAALFLGASYFNANAAINSPHIYLDYAKLNVLPMYRDFINGFFANHTTTFVVAIAAGQFLIALGLILNKTWTKIACVGGIIFGLAITPLGVGSAFPATILMAIAFYVLLRNYEHDFIWKWTQYKQLSTDEKRIGNVFPPSSVTIRNGANRRASPRQTTNVQRDIK